MRSFLELNTMPIKALRKRLPPALREAIGEDDIVTTRCALILGARDMDHFQALVADVNARKLDARTLTAFHWAVLIGNDEEY